MLVFHRSLGITIFAVLVLRLAWRLTHPAPPLPSDTPRVMELADWLLYALLLLMPVTGYLQSTDGRPVSYFGLFNLPELPKDKALGDVANVLHLLGQWGVYTLVGLHVGATVWQLLYDATDCSIACFRRRIKAEALANRSPEFTGIT